MELLPQSYINSSLKLSCIAKLAIYLNLKKLNGDKTKLEAFFAQLNLKLEHNIDHFIQERQNTEQNTLGCNIFRLEKVVFMQIKPTFQLKTSTSRI